MVRARSGREHEGKGQRAMVEAAVEEGKGDWRKRARGEEETLRQNLQRRVKRGGCGQEWEGQQWKMGACVRMSIDLRVPALRAMEQAGLVSGEGLGVQDVGLAVVHL